MAAEPVSALLVDGLNLVRRVFSALERTAGPAAGDETIRSTAGSLERALRRHRPTHAVGVFEGEGPSWRHALFTGYKAGRAPMPGTLDRALPAIVSVFETAGVRCLSRVGYEADDLIATMADRIAREGARVVILSTDTSFCQMLRPRIAVHDHFGDRSLDREFVRRRFGVEPVLLGDLLALAGVPSTGIPGIKGIGRKTAARLLDEYGGLEAVLAAAGEVGGRVGRLLVVGADQARLSRRLVGLETDLRLGVSLKQFRLMGRG